MGTWFETLYEAQNYAAMLALYHVETIIRKEGDGFRVLTVYHVETDVRKECDGFRVLTVE